MEKELFYTGENKSFRYTDGDYVTTGQKVIAEGAFIRVDGGNIMKAEAFIGSFNYSVENGAMKNLWLNMADPSESVAFIAQLNGCFTALNEEDKAE